MRKDSWAVTMWSDGDYIDLWHVNHFLAGVLCGCLAVFLNMELWPSLLVSVILFVAWEVFEIVNNIEETKFNTALDVILSIIAFLLVFYSDLARSRIMLIFLASFGLWAAMQIWGYLAYKSRFTA